MSASETPLTDAIQSGRTEQSMDRTPLEAMTLHARALESDHRAMREALEQCAKMRECWHARSVLAGLKVKA